VNATLEIHDAQHAKEVIERNSGVAPKTHLAHPHKKWTVDGEEYLKRAEKIYRDCLRDGLSVEDATYSAASTIPVTFSFLVAEPPQDEPAVEEPSAPPFLDSTPEDNPMLRTALHCVEKGWYVFPLREKSKEPDGELAPKAFYSAASNDPAVVRDWWTRKPNNNIGIDLRRSNLTVLDFDNGKPPAELGLPNTLQVSTSRGTHVYLSGVSKQGDMSVNGVHVGEIKSAGGYVLAPFSVHPNGSVYSVVVTAPVAPVPDRLIERLRPERKSVDASVSGEKIPRGQHDTQLHRIAGKLRGIGMEEEAIYTTLVEICEKRCENYGNDYLDMCRKHAKNAAEKYPVNESKDLAFTQQPANSATVAPPVPAKLPTTDYPKFPHWVMEGTSIYEGFVKPYCEVNARIPYFMWAPCAAMLLNYVGCKVDVSFKGWMPSLYMFLVGKKSRTKKSSSIKDAMSYLELAGVLSHYSKYIKNAEGKSFVWDAGSPEGLGTDMVLIKCKNAILFYDEMSKLVAKANIQGSAMKDALLKLYESSAFSNSIKVKKGAFSIAPNSYTASLISATTTREFGKLWGLLSDGADGLDSRSMFLLEPKELPEKRLQHIVNFNQGALKTKALIDKAVNQKIYTFFDQTPLQKFMDECGEDDRVEIRAEKWALYFAIDLGLDEIDEDCVFRGIELARYELAVKKFLMTMESKSELAALQQDIIRKLSYHGGQMRLTALKIAVEAKLYDTNFWWKAYAGLRHAGNIAESVEANHPQKPKVVTLIQGFDYQESDDEQPTSSSE
jgi:hypothetical protein